MDIFTQLVGDGAHDIRWWQMAVRAVLVLAFALLLYRIMPRRAFAGSAAIDMAVMIIVGSSLSRTLTGNAPFYLTIWGVSVFAAVYIALATCARKNPWVSRLVKGEPVLVIANGQTIPAAMRKVKLGPADIAEHLRLNNIAALKDVSEARVERNGAFSFKCMSDDDKIGSV